MKNGKIIFLNGVTSSGKTTVACEMQSLSPRQLYRFSNDMFFEAVPHKLLSGDFLRYHAEAIFHMYSAAHAVSGEGIDIIIDGMLLDCEWQEGHYARMREAFADRELTMIQLFCPLDECRRRNIARGNRGENHSEWQNGLMTKKAVYDLTLDTSLLSSRECAKRILKLVFPEDGFDEKE